MPESDLEKTTRHLSPSAVSCERLVIDQSFDWFDCPTVKPTRDNGPVIQATLRVREYHLENEQLVVRELERLCRVLHMHYPAGLEMGTVAAMMAIALAHVIVVDDA